MKKLIPILFILIHTLTFSQINFEKGYIIKSNDVKIECLIRNVAWKNNPTFIEYKASENEATQKITINEMKEFNVGSYKYKRFTTNIDRSSDNLNSMSHSKPFEFISETLFLKVLIEGPISLYSYEDGNLSRYFTSTGTEAEQLNYKQYIDDKTNSVAENLQFKQQLHNLLKGDNLQLKDFENLNYKEKELIKLFEKYYATTDTYSNFKEKQNKSIVNFKAVIGVNFSTAKANNSIVYSSNYDFESKAIPNLGLEVEYVLPFNQNKWAIFFNPSYQKYEQTAQRKYMKASFDYSFIDLCFGVRHYFYVSQNSKIFVNAGYTPTVNLDSQFFQGTSELEVSKSANFFIGAGFNYKRYGLEARYNFKRNFLQDYTYWSSEYNSYGITFSYKFL